MRDPAVTVVMAVRNAERYVGQAVSSVVQQTLADFQLIVVDDNSTDATPAIVERLGDSRVKLLRGDGAGAAAARNQGLAHARGEYIGFLDGDDIWDAAKLDAHVAVLRANPDVDLTFSRSRYISAEGQPMAIPVRRTKGRFDFESLLVDNVIGNGSAVVARRSAIPPRGFDETVSACMDYDLWLRIASSRRQNVMCVPQVLTSYRRHGGQVSQDWERMEQAWIKLFERMRKLDPVTVARAEHAATANWYRYLSYLAYERGESGIAASWLMRSVRASPPVAATTARTFMLAAAIASRAALPRGAHQALERAVARAVSSRRAPESPAGAISSWRNPSRS